MAIVSAQRTCIDPLRSNKMSISMRDLHRFASRGGDLLLPVWATSSLPPLPVKAGWRGRKALSGCTFYLGGSASPFKHVSEFPDAGCCR